MARYQRKSSSNPNITARNAQPGNELATPAPSAAAERAERAAAAAEVEPVRRVTKAQKAAAAEDTRRLLDLERLAEDRKAERAREAEEAAARADAPQRRGARKPRPEIYDEDGVLLTRRSMRDFNGNKFDVPLRLQMPGWSYEYKTIRNMGAPADSYDLVECYENGWRPVKATEIPELCPPGWKEPHVERGGQLLMKRPIHLTEEARDESIVIAEEQRYDKLKGALAGPQELGKIAPRLVRDVEVIGVAGYAPDLEAKARSSAAR